MVDNDVSELKNHLGLVTKLEISFVITVIYILSSARGLKVIFQSYFPKLLVCFSPSFSFLFGENV